MTHTKEPWSFRPKKYDDWGAVRGAVRGADGYYACNASYLADDPMSLDDHRRNGTNPAEANGERIVSCVNALAGISDPVAWVIAMKEVQRLIVAKGFPVGLANAWLDAKAAEEGS